MNMDNSNKILITGATGQQGGAVARELLRHGFNVRAMTRKPESEKAQELAGLGAEIVRGDLDDSTSLEQAVKGVWGVFGVQNTWEAGVEKEEEQGKRLANIARAGGVQYYVYTSVASAQQATGIPHFDNKFRVEEEVRRLNFPFHTVIRPAFFMENWNTQWFKPGIDQGNVMIGIKPSTVLQMIAVEDIGKYGLWVFQNHKKLNGRAIELAGDALTMPAVAKTLSSVIGKPIGFVQLPIDEVRKFSQDFAIMLEWLDKVGYSADIQGMSQESGIRPTPFSEWSKKIKW